MKRRILLSLFVIGTGITLTFTGCSKDDTTSPDITLVGDASIELVLNSAAWTDLGATANDDEDGAVTVTSDASATNPNTNLVGTYEITYTSVDAAGNIGTAIRTIRVYNAAENYAGNYDVHDTVPGLVFNYPQVITVHTSINNRIIFNRFGDYANNTAIYANKIGNGTLEIPSQTAVDIGTLDTTISCSVSTHQFSGFSSTVSTSIFTINYNDQITAPGGCAGSATTGVATYTKQ